MLPSRMVAFWRSAPLAALHAPAGAAAGLEEAIAERRLSHMRASCSSAATGPPAAPASNAAAHPFSAGHSSAPDAADFAAMLHNMNQCSARLAARSAALQSRHSSAAAAPPAAHRGFSLQARAQAARVAASPMVEPMEPQAQRHARLLDGKRVRRRSSMTLFAPSRPSMACRQRFPNACVRCSISQHTAHNCRAGASGQCPAQAAVNITLLTCMYHFTRTLCPFLVAGGSRVDRPRSSRARWQR